MSDLVIIILMAIIMTPVLLAFEDIISSINDEKNIIYIGIAEIIIWVIAITFMIFLKVITMIIFWKEINLNELCLNPLPKCENSIIKYADQTKDHLLPATLDDIYLPIPEEKTIDGTTKVIITDPKKLYMPMCNDILYDSICDKFFDGEDFICNISGRKKSYEYQVSSDRKQADLHYNYGTRTESTHIDISDRYKKFYLIYSICFSSSLFR